MLERISSYSVSQASRATTIDKPETQQSNPQDVIQSEKNKQFVKEQEKAAKQLSREELEGIVESLNDFLLPAQTSLKFELHDKLNEFFVQVIDASTEEVVREIPSKKMLDFYAAMTEFVGLMVDKKI